MEPQTVLRRDRNFGQQRAQEAQAGWPPHLCIGTKVFYRRDAVAAWLLRQEANCQLEGATTTAADRDMVVPAEVAGND